MVWEVICLLFYIKCRYLCAGNREQLTIKEVHMGKLTGKHFLITGASSGIGLSTLKLFIAEGAVVTGMARGMDVFAQKLHEHGIPAEAVELVKGNAGLAADVEKVVARANSRFGRLHGLVHSAGLEVSGPFMGTSLEQWNEVVQTNLTSTYLLSRAMLAQFGDEAGVITFVASGAGLRPLPNRALYSATKAGVIALGKSIAAEVALLKGIRVNTICPGIIDTPMLERAWKEAPDPEAALKELKSRNSMHRFAHVAALHSARP